MAVNVVIAQAGAGKVGAVGASEAACRDLGSVKEVSLVTKGVTYSATQANRGNQPVLKSKGPTDYSLTLVLEEITKENFAASIDASIDSTGKVSVNSQNQAMEYWCGYFHGFLIDGVAKTLHILKASVVPDSTAKLGTDGEQQLISLTYELMVDVDSVLVDAEGAAIDVLEFVADAVDTTAPTCTVVPATAATAVAKAAGGTVVWTFDEPIRAEDVNDAHFYVHADDGAMVAGTLTRTDTTVTFTWTGALAGTKEYYAIAKKGVRDVAGNKMVADKSTVFTTGA